MRTNTSNSEGGMGLKVSPVSRYLVPTRTSPQIIKVFILYVPLFLSPLLNISQSHFVKTNLMDTSSQNFWESTGVFFRIAPPLIF